MTQKKYNEMTIDQLHTQMREIKKVFIAKDRGSSHSLIERDKFRKMFFDSVSRLTKEVSVDSITELYFECNSLGYAVHPTKAELVDLIKRALNHEGYELS